MSDQTNLPPDEDRELPEIDPATLDEDVPEIEPVEEPLTLIDDDEMQLVGSKITAAGQGALSAGMTDFKRGLNNDGSGATRCKIFHSKISPVPLEYMEKQINEWLDRCDAEVKIVSKVVGVMEGKRPEPNLIVTIWY